MTVKYIAASINAKLSEKARADKRPLQELLEHYSMERFLYRLSISQHRDVFVLKGALLLRVWDELSARPTRDIDFLGRTDNSMKNVEKIVKEICEESVQTDDGLSFQDFKTETIREDADYEGVRVRFKARLANIKIPMQVDVGFGDIMVPGAKPITYPTLLDMSEPKLIGYPLESVVAEKLEAITKLGTINSRMKDFYDLHKIIRRFDFNGPMLAKAIRSTFEHRATVIDSLPVGLSTKFAASNLPQWQAFMRRMKLDALDFQDLLREVGKFAQPLLEGSQNSSDFDKQWRAPGPWR